MTKYFEPHVYRLLIDNRTRQDLVVENCRLAQGVWFRGEVDGERPISVPAGTEIEALGVRAQTTRRSGYEFRCSWRGAAGDSGPDGLVTLFVSVPFLSGRNRAGLDVSRRLKVSGWTGVSTIGHAFEHRLVVGYAL